MSVIGKPCLFCNENIIVETEASRCLRCGNAFHRACATAAGDLCLRCQEPLDYQERAYAFSMKCPECLAPNAPFRDRCSGCGAWTRWNNQAEYENFVISHRVRCRQVIKKATITLVVLLVGGGILFILLPFFLGAAIGTLVALKAGSLLVKIWDASRKLSFR